MGKKTKKKHKNVPITFAFVFQRRKMNVMLVENEFYVPWIILKYHDLMFKIVHSISTPQFSKMLRSNNIKHQRFVSLH